MTSDSRTPEEIERDIERERAELTGTLDTLQDRFSVEGIARQFSDQFREHGGDLGRSVTEAVKRNPMALALTGVGLAWLMMGDRNPVSRRNDPYEPRSDDRYDARDRGVTRDDEPSYARNRNEVSDYSSRPAPRGPALGPQPGNASNAYQSGRYSGASTPSWARTDHHDSNDGPGLTDRAKAAASTASDGVSGAASSAADTARRAGSSVADGARSMGDSASSAASSVADGVRHTAASASERATAMRAKLSEGIDHLGEDARRRVVAARERAVMARDSAAEYSQQGREKAVDLFEEHPLIAGALAVAVGAALGAALPRSRTEDHYFGSQRDALFEDAERIYAEETEKLGKVAKAATDEAKKIGNEIKSEADDKAPSAGQAVVDKAKEAGQRVADAAKSEAEKQKMGSTKS